MLNKITKTMALQQQVRTLENKVEILQQEIEISKKEPTAWNALRQKLVNGCMVPLVGGGGSWASMQIILDGISIIFKEVLDLEYLNQLSDEDYEAANEFIDDLVKFVSESYELRLPTIEERKKA